MVGVEASAAIDQCFEFGFHGGELLAAFADVGPLAPGGGAVAPVRAADGQLVGVVAALSRGPFERPELAAEALRLVAARLEPELHRRRAEAWRARRTHSAEILADLSAHLLEDPGDGSMRALASALEQLARLHGADLAGLLVLAGDPAAVDEVVEWRASAEAPALGPLRGRRAAELPWSERGFLSGEVTRGTWVEPGAAAGAPEVPRHVVALPISSTDTRGRWLGVLALARSGPAWPDGELPELRIAAATLVGALLRERRARRRRARGQRLRRQARAVVELARSASPPEGDELARIAEMAAETLEVDLANVWLFNEERSLLLPEASWSRGVGGPRRLEVAVADHPRYFAALFENRFVDADDALADPRTSEFRAYYERVDIRSTLDAAVRLAGRTIGVVCLEHRGSLRRWEEDEKGFAGTIADLLALAVEERKRRRTAATLEARNRELEALNSIGGIAQEHGPDDALYPRIVAEVARATSFPVVTVEMLDAARDVVVVEALRGAFAPEGVERVELPAGGDGPGPRAIATGEPVVVTGDDLRPRHLHVPGPLRFVLCTPLLVGGRAIGAMCLGSPQEPADRAAVESLARTLGHAVASLIERRRAREQEELLEKQAAEARRLEAVATLAGGIAHDFNNLMTGVMGYTALLKQDAEPGDEVWSAAEMIEGAAERAGELTQQLLSYGRRGKQRDVVFDAHRIVREVAALIAPALPAGVELALELAATRSTVRGDPGQLHQALMNLAVNARDAMPGGGTLRLASREVLDEPAEVGQGPAPGPRLELVVADTGAGIDPAVRPRIFEPFFTTKPPGKGTGMGLAMVHGIAVDHGGSVHVDSRTGEGTSFRLSLPLLAEGAAEEAGARPTRGSGRVWIADDEAIVRGTASELLRSLGYAVEAFPDGAQLLERFRAEPGAVDLVLLDVVMPGMDGRETLRALREVRPDVRVLLTSGWDRVGARRSAAEDGALGFLPKPYQLEELAATVARAVRGERV